MSAVTMILCWALVFQTAADQAYQLESPETSTSPDSAVTSDVDISKPAASRLRPPELVVEAVTLPSGSAVTGQPLTLVQALSASPDRRLQLAITHAYWQAVEAAAKYNYHVKLMDRLGRLPSGASEQAALQAAHSAATAQLREAEISAGSAQHELAALMQLPGEAALPLPVDRPHVGAYRTNFQSLFAARPAPDRARIIDRTLPIRRMAIDQRAIAVQAAKDALEAAIDACQANQCGLASVISASDRLIGQQIAFVETVCRYNHDIAEYAMVVAAPGATPQLIAGFMIKTTTGSGQSPGVNWDGGVRPAGLQETESAPANWNESGQPAVAPRGVQGASPIPTVPPATKWESSPALKKNQPGMVPLTDIPAAREKITPTPAGSRSLPAGGKNQPTLAPKRVESKTNVLRGTRDQGQGESAPQQSDTIPDAEDEYRPVPLENKEPAKIRHDSGDPFMRRVQKVDSNMVEVTEDTTPANMAERQDASTDYTTESTAPAALQADASTALYPALVDAKPAERAKQLALALHWDRSLPEGTGRPMTLEECLSRQIGGDRRPAIEAFWNARQCAAEYQAVSQELEFLDSLVPLVLERREKPQCAAEMLFLHAARQNAKTQLFEANAQLIEAQFELALRTQSAGESLWPLPTTAPHAGQYRLNLETQSPALRNSWPMRRLAAVIPEYGESVQQRAASVVTADTARAKAFESYITDRLPIEEVLDDVTRQTLQTHAFLQVLTDYNCSIAQYALSVLPADAQPSRIAAALVVK
jgi:hypothetical protein